MKKLIIMLGLSAIAAQSMAVVGDVSTNPQLLGENYCVNTRGSSVTLTSQYDTTSGVQKGIERGFCQYQNDFIGLETLSTTPSLAATYAKQVVWSIKDILYGSVTGGVAFSNLASELCYKLNGVELGSQISQIPNSSFVTQSGDKHNICVFGDGSAIASATLMKMATGSADGVKKLIRAEPLKIEIPKL